MIDVGDAVEVLLQLPGEAALAHAGTAHDGHQVWPSIVDGTADGLLEQRQFGVAPDQPGLKTQSCSAPTPPGLDRHDAPGGDSHDLAFQLDGGQLLVVDRVASRRVGRRFDDDRPGLSDALEARCRIDRIASDEEVALRGGTVLVHEHLSRGHTDAQLQLRPLPRVGRHGRDDRLHLDGRADSTLGVVLVRGRYAEDREHRVAGELLDGALVALDLAREPFEECGGARGDQLRVVGLVEAREADDVGEQQGRGLAFAASIALQSGGVLARLGHAAPDRRSAVRAETGTLGKLCRTLAAARDHWRPAEGTEARRGGQGRAALPAAHQAVTVELSQRVSGSGPRMG